MHTAEGKQQSLAYDDNIKYAPTAWAEDACVCASVCSRCPTSRRSVVYVDASASRPLSTVWIAGCAPCRRSRHSKFQGWVQDIIMLSTAYMFSV